MKKIMKNGLALVLLTALLLSMTACGQNQQTASTAATPPEVAASGADRFADFPTRTITIYNSSSAGSPADVMARELARSLEDITGQVVNVVNATGGGGGVMFGSVFRNPTDCYTWGSFTAAQIASLQAGLVDDFPIENFDFVANIQTDTFAFAVQADSPWETLEDLIEYARGANGGLLMGGQGTGSGMHLCALQLGKDGEFDFVWIPFDGGAESVVNLLGGHVDVIMSTSSTVRDYVAAGMMRKLAITGDGRLSTTPDVPTFAELGFPDVAFSQYRGVFVQTGTDPDLVVRISELIREATLSDTFLAYMALVHMDDTYMDNVEFTEFVLDDFARIGRMAEDLLN